MEKVASASAECLAHADVVFEDLSRRSWYVRCAVEEMVDDVIRE